ncbi:hypothetical protein [Devosia sp.]|uniref:hypothetical protein n=1 Tax=Devosia sp. TaxID=1871048 RepID=UPI003265FAB9
MTRTTLSPRTINAYNRFAKEIAAINFIRREKPSGALGSSTVATCNKLVAAANRLFKPEPDMPRFLRIDPTTPMTQADLRLLTARLTAAALDFEERYAHLSGTTARLIDRSGLPSPHRH